MALEDYSYHTAPTDHVASLACDSRLMPCMFILILGTKTWEMCCICITLGCIDGIMCKLSYYPFISTAADILGVSDPTRMSTHVFRALWPRT